MAQYSMIHTMIRVRDLERSIAFYRDAFGLKEVRRREKPEGKFTLAFLSDGVTGFQLELTYNYDPVPTYDLGTGYGHLAMSVADLEASHAAHTAAGYDVGPLKGLDGVPNYYFITDPDGYKIEVIRAK